MPEANAPNGAEDGPTKLLSIRLLARAAALATAFFVFAFIGIELTREAGGVATFWPANAILLVALLRSDGGAWPIYVVACAIANFAANLTFDPNAVLALGFTASNMTEAVIGAFLVRHFCHAPFTLGGLRSATCLLIWGAVVGPAIGALGGATTLTLISGSAFPENWTAWWLADAMGIVIFAPLLLTWTSTHLTMLKSRVFVAEALAILTAVAVVGVTDFAHNLLVVVLLIIPILLWAAVRLGTFWCALAGACFTATVFGHLAYGMHPTPLVADSISMIQLFLGVAILSPLAVAITLGERARVASALSDSQERLRDFAESGSDWFFETDAQLRFTYFQGQRTETGEQLDTELLGKTLWQVAGGDPETDERWWAFLRDANARRDFRGVEIHDPILTGLPRYSRWNGKPFYGPDGTFKGYRGTGRDITGIHEQEARLAEIVNNIVEGLIVANENGTIESVNPPMEAMYGYSAAELVGRNVTMLMTDADAEIHDSYLANYLRTGEKRIIGLGREVVSVRKNGTVFPVELAVGEIAMDGERKYVGVIRDISERKQAAAERERFLAHFHEAQKVEALGTLARGIAHDFNNALFPIIGLTELTVSTLPDDSTAQETLSKVLTAAYHARDLVRQILAFSRIDPPNRAPVEIARVVHDATSFLRAALPSTIDIVETYDDADGFVLADETQIYQVIVNLGSNAQDAMSGSGGVLSIKLTKVPHGDRDEKSDADANLKQSFKLTVSDTGRGMDEETRARIFEPFFTTKQDARGTGLGLSVVHDIVANHDGILEVRSKPQQGTEFDILLPVCDGTGDPARDTPDHPDTPASGSAEDDGN